MPAKTITIQQVTSKDGVNKKGKPYTKWGIKDQDGEWFNTFNSAQAEKAQEFEGSDAAFEIGYEVGKFGNDLTSIAGPVANDDVSSQARSKREPKASADPGVDWDAKERRDFKSRAWAQALTTIPYLITVEEIQKGATPKDIYNRVKPLQQAIYLDICADILPSDADIPF